MKLKNNENILIDQLTDKDTEIYSIISYTIVKSYGMKNPVHVIYLLNLRDFKISNFKILDNKAKSNNVIDLLEGLKTNTLVITLNLPPFSTNIVSKFFKYKKIEHKFYGNNHYTPIIDYSKNYFNGMVRMTLLNNPKNNDQAIYELVDIWNKDFQPMLYNIAQKYNFNPSILFLNK